MLTPLSDCTSSYRAGTRQVTAGEGLAHLFRLLFEGEQVVLSTGS